MKRSILPASSGVGFKPEHFKAICEAAQPIGFFEVHAENYMGAGGMPHVQLSKLREDYSLSIHGVGLSIGSMQPLDREHLSRLKVLCDRYQPDSFSEHLAWSSHDSVFLNDLLPLPYTETTLARICAHIDEVQTTLGRQMLLENPATYLLFAESTIPETHSCGRSHGARDADCCSTSIMSSSPRSIMGSIRAPILRRFPFDHVREIHLAGHSVTADETGAALLIDTHDKPVADPVWSLYAEVVERIGAMATLIEWDGDIPDWPVLRAEAGLAQAILDRTPAQKAA